MQWQDATKWACDRCTFLNPLQLKKCSVCEQEKPASFVPMTPLDAIKPLPVTGGQATTESKLTEDDDQRNAWGEVDEVDETDYDQWGDVGEDEEGSGGWDDAEDGVPQENGDDEGDGWDNANFMDEETQALCEMKLDDDVDEIEWPFVCLSERDLQKQENKIVHDMSELLGIGTDQTASLLRHFRWKQNKLLEEWMKDSDKVSLSAGISGKEVVKKKKTGTIDCFLCIETVPVEKTFSLPCGHQYCTVCWESYLKAEYEKGPNVIYTSCVEYKCKEVVPEQVFRTLLPYSLYQKVKQWYRHSYVDGNQNTVKWCPSPGCKYACESTIGGDAEVSCDCGYSFCFACLNSAHKPATCITVKKWSEKNASDSENYTWIKANTKDCPKCKVHIEKNQGCMHMTCRKCRHEFCWICKGNWKNHKSCNKSPETIEREQTQQNAARDLERYLHYYERFDGHLKAINFAQKTRHKAKRKMEVILQTQLNTSVEHVQFILNAVEELIHCHRVLAWTYCFGYYLRTSGIKLALFEGHQGRLEEFTDQLHELTEKPLEELREISVRTIMINKTRVIGGYRNNVIKCVEDGHLS